MNAMAVKFGFVENHILKHIARFEQKIFVYDMNGGILMYARILKDVSEVLSHLLTFNILKPISENQHLI